MPDQEPTALNDSQPDDRVSLLPGAESEPPAPGLFTVGRGLLYLLLLAALIAGIGVGLGQFRQWIDRYQTRKDRYAAERALDALAQGNEELAKEEVRVALTELPIYRDWLNRTNQEIWEGPVLRNRVTIFEQLSARLLAADLGEQADAIGLKSIIEYHIPSRIVEIFEPWELMYHIKAVEQDWVSVFEIARILAAHGLDHVRQPRQIQPLPLDVDPSVFKESLAKIPSQLSRGLQQFYAGTTPPEFAQAASTLQQAREKAGSPSLRQRIDAAIHRSLILAGQRAEARKFLGERWGRNPEIMDPFWREWPKNKEAMNLLDRDPTLLDLLWNDRPATATQSVNQFVDSFMGDQRVQVVFPSGLKRKNIGYFNLRNQIRIIPEGVGFPQSVAASVPVHVSRNVHRIFLAFDATPALGIYPIVLMRINEDPYVPVYMDSDAPTLGVAMDRFLQPGDYNFEFVFLNDAAFTFPRKNIMEDRNWLLRRIVLVNVPPSDQP